MIQWLGEHREALIKAVAVVQIVVAMLNFGLVRMLGWREELARMPLLLRQVFQVHLWFISITLAIFGVLSLRFAHQMAHAETEIATWLAGAIGAFWGIRAILQVTYYSSEHWRGRPGPTLVHIMLLIMYGSMSVVYLLACTRGVR